MSNTTGQAFGLSNSRCGTVTLSKLFALSPSLSAHHEPKPTLYLEAVEAYKNRTDLTSTIFKGREELVRAADRENKFYVELTPHISSVPDSILRAFPEARFFFIHRHPYEFIRSGMRRGYYVSSLARLSPREDDPISERWSSLQQIEKIAWGGAKMNEIILEFFAGLPPEKKLTLSFQELIQGKVGRVFEFLGSPVPSEKGITEVLRKRWNKQEIGSFDWTDKERRVVKPYISSIVAKLGYEL